MTILSFVYPLICDYNYMLYSWISVIIFEYGVGLTVVSRYPILEADFTVYHEHGPYAGKII